MPLWNNYRNYITEMIASAMIPVEDLTVFIILSIDDLIYIHIVQMAVFKDMGNRLYYLENKCCWAVLIIDR